ncbi:MAG: hypothetical protein HYV19_00045 [Gemmatimonadetes bacterium]|nr:hypothetical protein [Gemmatimonadota bacterium]
MKRRLGVAAVVAVLLALLSTDVAAQAKGQRKATEAKKAAPERMTEQERGANKAKGAVSTVFRSGDREAFQRYFASHNMRAKPLPPGMAKRLAKGKPLPPGIAKQVMPPDLLKIAAPLPKGAEYGIVGDAVVVSKAGVVLDILAGVLK